VHGGSSIAQRSVTNGARVKSRMNDARHRVHTTKKDLCTAAPSPAPQNSTEMSSGVFAASSCSRLLTPPPPPLQSRTRCVKTQCTPGTSDPPTLRARGLLPYNRRQRVFAGVRTRIAAPPLQCARPPRPLARSARACHAAAKRSGLGFTSVRANATFECAGQHPGEPQEG